MGFLPLSDVAARHFINATAVWSEHNRVARLYRPYRAGMHWKRVGAYEYLVKTHSGGKHEHLGRKSEQTETIYADFHRRKDELAERLRSLGGALVEAERFNNAAKVGRVPSTVISVLQAIESAGLGEHFVVVGTHALYAYEAAAGVRIIAQGAMETEDVDLLWDARKRLRFLADLQRLDASMLDVLRKADKSFLRKEGRNETAINNKGFQVDFLRRQRMADDPHPFRFSDDEDDLWSVQAVRASVLTSAARFEHLVVGTTGRMALMRTIPPVTFVEFKRWMSREAPGRAEAKRRRDARQADIVQQLLDHLLVPV